MTTNVKIFVTYKKESDSKVISLAYFGAYSTPDDSDDFIKNEMLCELAYQTVVNNAGGNQISHWAFTYEIISEK